MDTVSSLSRVASMKVVPARPDPCSACGSTVLVAPTLLDGRCTMPSTYFPRLLATCYHPTYPTVTPRPTPQ